MKEKSRVIFSKRLNIAIANSEWSQRKLATHLGVSGNTVNSWATGKSWPGFDNLDILCKILNTTPQWLMGADDTQATKNAAINEIKALLDMAEKATNSDSVVKGMISSDGPINLSKIPPSILEKLSRVSEKENIEFLEELVDAALIGENEVKSKLAKEKEQA